MTTVILISTVALLVAIVGCAVIWRMDASRAEEVDRQAPAPRKPPTPLDPARTSTPPASLPAP